MTNFTISDIGYRSAQVDLLSAAARRAHGLILFAGVSGSGKTTAQRAIANAVAAENGSVFDVDEIRLPQGVGAKGVLGDLLRRSPNFVMAGDVRDRSVGDLVRQLVETGHKVSGSIFAHTLKGIMPRVTGESVGLTRQFLTAPHVLSLLVYQGLAKKTCSHCSLGVGEVSRGDASWDACKRIVAILEKRFKLDIRALRFRREGGCSNCQERGWVGVKVIAEMAVPDATWLALSRDGDDQAAYDHWRSQSDRRLDSPDVAGKTAFEQCVYFALKGIVDPRECLAFERFEHYSPLP